MKMIRAAPPVEGLGFGASDSLGGRSCTLKPSTSGASPSSGAVSLVIVVSSLSVAGLGVHDAITVRGPP